MKGLQHRNVSSKAAQLYEAYDFDFAYIIILVIK